MRPGSPRRTSKSLDAQAGAARRHGRLVAIYLHVVQVRRAHDLLRHDDVREDGGDRRVERRRQVAVHAARLLARGPAARRSRPRRRLPIPSLQWIYAASPGGRIYKLSVANGHAGVERLDHAAAVAGEDRVGAQLRRRATSSRRPAGTSATRRRTRGTSRSSTPRAGRLLHVWNSLCSDRHGPDRAHRAARRATPPSGAASGAVVDPATGDLLVATGNAPWDGKTNWGDAVLRLSPDATKLLGNYTPSNTAQLNSSDLDLGSTSPVAARRGLSRAGRQGREDPACSRVARMRGTAPHQGGELQVVSTPSGTDLFTAPAVWHTGSSTWMFAADNGGTAAWRFRSGRHLTRRGSNPRAARARSSPAGSSGSTRPAAASTSTRRRRASSSPTLPCGGGHWNSPIVVDGRVALPEGNANDHATSGVLDIWSSAKCCALHLVKVPLRGALAGRARELL